MEATDPFVPTLHSTESAYAEIPATWGAPFSSVGAASAGAPTEQYPFGAETPLESDSRAAEEDELWTGPPAHHDDEPWSAPVALLDVESPHSAESPAPTPATALDGNTPGPTAARAAATALAQSLKDLEQSLTESEAERAAFLADRRALQERVSHLEEEAQRKEAFRATLLTGAGAALSGDDLRELQRMTDALTADPDRLTLLFGVVQQASKLATIVNVYSTLRGMADEA